MHHNNRRKFFKKLGLGLASISYSFSGFSAESASFKMALAPDAAGPLLADDFADVHDRIWLGEKYWAIPMEDWRVKSGRLEFTGEQKFARVNMLTSLIKEGNGEFSVAVNLGLLQANNSGNKTGSAGFCIGVKDELDPDVKAACYFGQGLNVGINTQGILFIADQTKALPANFNFSDFNLSVIGNRANNITQLTLTCKGANGKTSELTYQTEKDVDGVIALVNNFEERGGEKFWFKSPQLSGSKIYSKPENSFGPVLWTMYTLSKGTLKLSAQMPPIGVKDNQEVELHLKKNNQWEKVSNQKIDPMAFLAVFELTNWDAGKDVPYQVIYRNKGQVYNYNGIIRQEPLNRPLRFGGLTCQEWEGYPYTPLVNNLKKHNPDLLYFSGDQLYEGNGGYPIKRQPESDSILSYLGKWYMFGWTFGDVMRDRPTICTPDDHDVFQGNLWGDGGVPISFESWEQVKDAKGGYVQTPKMVNVVGKTQCGHMPASFHPEPLTSGIETWYTDLVYGKVSFAVISDRMFKSGPEAVRKRKPNERLDHIKEPLAKNELEDPNLKFLGDRQMQFLERWINDWQGADMKVLLSQTLFCNVGTHHGPTKMFLYGDMDSGGWPKQKRDDVLRLIRKAFTFHINGDQHLPFMVQYSLDNARDGGWTFCTPAISTGYIRWGEPDSVQALFTNRPEHGLPNTGLYKDIFGNNNFVYAVGNPLDNFQNKNRYLKAQNKASGFGIITFDTAVRTIKMEAFRFLADKDKPNPNDQFPGWPLTISQTDNDGRKPQGFLPRLKLNKPNQVVKIINEKNNELVNVLRIKGSDFSPGVPEAGKYTIVVGEGNAIKEFKGLKSSSKEPKKVIKVHV